MNKIVAMSLSAAVALNAADINNMFAAGKAEGQIRAAYVNQDNAVDTDTYGASIGGVLKYETAGWNGVKLGVAAYISQKLSFATGDDERSSGDLFAEESTSYVYAGEAYIDYSTDNFNLRIGRQLIDTPLADTDNIRMHPNTFEAAIASYSGIEGMTLVGGYVTRWAGYDSGNDISKFKKLAGEDSDGAAVAGIVHEGIENLTVQGWYYSIDRLADAFYADATYAFPLGKSIGMELAGQFASFDEKNNSGLDGNVYGVGLYLNFGMLTVSAAYNKASNGDGKSVSNGFGGGPYVTSMEEMTIDGFEDAKAYQLSAEIDMADAGIDGLVLMALYGDFKSAPAHMKLQETDLIAAYTISKTLSAEVSYAMLHDENENTGDDGFTPYDGGYDRLLVRLDYNF